MRLSVLIVLCTLAACNQPQKTNSERIQLLEEHKDTTIVKQQCTLPTSYEAGFYSKSYSYYRLTGRDTVGFIIGVREHKNDSAVSLSVYYQKTMLFKNLLHNINQCIPLIREDFNLAKLCFINFKSPVYYPDLAKELSRAYEQKFDRKNISYQKLNGFLLTSGMNTQLNNLIDPLHKKVIGYNIEKFELLDEKDYYDYIPGTDVADYPEFTLNGMCGFYVRLGNK